MILQGNFDILIYSITTRITIFPISQWVMVISHKTHLVKKCAVEFKMDFWGCIKNVAPSLLKDALCL